MSTEEKLKTLKDIEINLKCTPNSSRLIIPVSNGKAKYLISDDIRDAAREWIKAHQEILDGFEVYLYDEIVKKREYQAINKWIEYFFNLNEEK